MVGLGTLINTGCIIIGGILGHFSKKLLTDERQDSLIRVNGVCVVFLGIAGALKYMLEADHTIFIILCIAIGTLIGEILNIEAGCEKIGEWLKEKTHNTGDAKFVSGFLNASLTVCIGAMAIIGSFADGMTGDWSILAAKGIIDLITVMIMTCSFGKGCIFSAIPVFILEGAFTLLAKLISPYITDSAMNNLSLVGSILIFCIGFNLMHGKKLRVANMLPALLLAVFASYIPF